MWNKNDKTRENTKKAHDKDEAKRENERKGKKELIKAKCQGRKETQGKWREGEKKR